MKKALILAAALTAICACSKTPSAHIEGTIADTGSNTVTLQRYTLSTSAVTDTVEVDGNGNFACKVKLDGASPAFYYICIGDKPAATLVLLPDDRVKVSIGDGGYSVEGSEESALLKEVTDRFLEAKAEIAGGTNAGQVYIDYRKYALRHVFTHARSITSAAMMYQKFNDNLPVFGEITDGLIFKAIYDSLITVYPTSEYLAALRETAGERERMMTMMNRIQNARTISFPEIEMPDVNGNLQSLTALEGKVIILSFWSVSQTQHKMFNRTLLEIYEKYSAKGLEIYQVCLDVDKPYWASTVRNQELPWISVNDGLGNSSPAVVAYNVKSLPAMFIIDRKGNVAGRDFYDPDELGKMIAKLL